MASMNTDEIYAEVNKRILDALTQAIATGKGGAPWSRPWVGAGSAPRNLQSGKTYRGINSLLLAFSDYSDPRWTTFAAAKKMGGKVRKGEKSTLVTLWKRIKRTDANGDESVFPILRYFRVFNVAQCDWPEGVLPALKEAEHPEGWDGNTEAEKVLRDYLASENAPTLSYGGSVAAYEPTRHHVRLPVAGDFWTAAGFYGTAFHESVHSTGHQTMLKRELSGRFGSSEYAQEELVAEIGAALVCATIGVDGGFDNSIAYLKHWSARIAADPKLIIRAAGKAQKAADRILGVTFDNGEQSS